MEGTSRIRPLSDPLIWLGAIVAVLVHAWMLFVGECLPYMDWSNHLALISVFAQGGETGALEFFERSYTPTVYYLFYAVTAVFAQVVAVPAAAKLSYLVATAAMTFGAASLAYETGRDPRVGLIAPLALFGMSFRWGFASFVFATPLALISLAMLERLVRTLVERADHRVIRNAALAFFAAIALLSMAHGLLYAVTVILVVLRVAWSRSLRAIVGVGVVGVLASLSVLPGLLRAQSIVPANAPEKIFVFEALSKRLARLPESLTVGGEPDLSVVFAATAVVLVLFVTSMVRPIRNTRTSAAPEIWATGLVVFYLWGPSGFEYPFRMWAIGERFAPLAFLALVFVPRASLRSHVGAVFAVAMLGVLTYNAHLNRVRIDHHAKLAARYEPVRAVIPRGATVLSIDDPPPGDWVNQALTLRSLHFYHLVDGARYSPYTFNLKLVPVSSRDPRPAHPWGAQANRYHPKNHGAQFDYVVLRGKRLIDKTVQAGLHEKILEHDRWVVFRTIR